MTGTTSHFRDFVKHVGASLADHGDIHIPAAVDYAFAQNPGPDTAIAFTLAGSPYVDALKIKLGAIPPWDDGTFAWHCTPVAIADVQRIASDSPLPARPVFIGGGEGQWALTEWSNG